MKCSSLGQRASGFLLFHSRRACGTKSAPCLDSWTMVLCLWTWDERAWPQTQETLLSSPKINHSSELLVSHSPKSEPEGVPVRLTWSHTFIWSTENRHRILVDILGNGRHLDSPGFNFCLVPKIKKKLLMLSDTNTQLNKLSFLIAARQHTLLGTRGTSSTKACHRNMNTCLQRHKTQTRAIVSSSPPRQTICYSCGHRG